MRLQLAGPILPPALLILFVFSHAVFADDKKAGGTEGSAITVKASTEVSGYADTDHVSVVSPSVAATVSNVLAGWSVSGPGL